MLLLIATAVYVCVPMLQGPDSRWSSHFPQLARAFLHGESTIRIEPGMTTGTAELIPTGSPNRYACPYPPLPAVLLMPFVLIFGSSVHVAIACRILSVINVLLFDACLDGLPRTLGRPPITGRNRLLPVCLFAFGSAAWSVARLGGDWHLAHTVALAAMLLALREHTTRSRPLVIGGFVALAMLSRPTAALTGLFFVLPLLRRDRLGALLRFAVAPAAAMLILAAYNASRFGAFWDFGYERMLLAGEGLRAMRAHGQFDQAFILRNVFWYFLAPPWLRPDHQFPWLGYDPRGMSLLLASPAFVYAIVGIRRAWSNVVVRHAAAACAVCLVPLLLYFNTGYWQFGHRFSMDYLPMLMVLVLAGMGSRPSRLAWVLAGLSVAIQAWGVLLDSVAWLPIHPTPIG